MKYIYFFETGCVWQMSTPPTPADHTSIKNGYMACYMYDDKADKLVEVIGDGIYKDVPIGKHFGDGSELYSFVKEVD